MKSRRENSAKTWVEISRSILRKNVIAVKRVIRPASAFAVVKSNAYGHGLVEVAKTLYPLVCGFAVDSFQEAVDIRKALPGARILIMGYVPSNQIRLCADHEFSIVAYDDSVLKAASKMKGRRPLHIHLKIETGTTRQGLFGDDLIRFATCAVKNPKVYIEGMYTHYANVEDTLDASYALMQLRRFEEMIQRLGDVGVCPDIIHSAASAAAMLHPSTRFGCVRLGIVMYGYWPSVETSVAMKRRRISLSLQPALSWKTVVAQVKDVEEGTPVSYGLTERVSRKSKVAILPVGYWDGYDRGLSSIGHVLIRGKRCKILGRVCMNMTIIDVTGVKGVKTGDEVVLIGRQGKGEITADDIASKIGSISYEVLTRINPLIERRMV